MAAADPIAVGGKARAPCSGQRRRHGGAGIARTLAAMAVFLIGATISQQVAEAADWSVSGSVSTGLQADTNRDLERGSDPTYGATARLGLEAAAVTDNSLLAIRTGVSARAFGGPGDTEGLNGSHPDFRGQYDYFGKYFDFGTSVSVQYEPASFAQIDETGVTEGDATQLTIGVGSYASYAMTQRDSLTSTANLSLKRFTAGQTELRPTTTIGTSLGWSRALSQITSWNLNFGARHFEATGESPEERLTFDLTTGLQHQFNSRLSVNGNGGVTATEIDDGYEFGLTGALGAAWQAAPDTSFTLSMNHGIQPSSLGELRTSTSVGLGMAHGINSWTDLAMSLSWSKRSSVAGDTINRTSEDDQTLIRLGSSLSFDLARAWSLGVGHRLTVDHGDNAVDNRVFMQLTRQFTILP